MTTSPPNDRDPMTGHSSGGITPETDVFAYHNSGLEPFLFAEIGTDPSGLSITVLSALARNGEDPWGTAAQWARAPRANVIDRLAAEIARLPLARAIHDDDRETATRLAQLLPSSPARAGHTALINGPATLGWGAMMLLAGGVIVIASIVAASLHPNSAADHRGGASTDVAPVTTGQ